jgi:hypothetical protein
VLLPIHAQVVEQFPTLLGYSKKTMAAHIAFLLNDVGVSEAKLGQVHDMISL